MKTFSGPRFEAAPWSLVYLRHQRDGKFWRSPVRPLSEIKVPCFLIGGLAGRVSGQHSTHAGAGEGADAGAHVDHGTIPIRTMLTSARASSGAKMLSAGGTIG